MSENKKQKELAKPRLECANNIKKKINPCDAFSFIRELSEKDMELAINGSKNLDENTKKVTKEIFDFIKNLSDEEVKLFIEGVKNLDKNIKYTFEDIVKYLLDNKSKIIISNNDNVQDSNSSKSLLIEIKKNEIENDKFDKALKAMEEVVNNVDFKKNNDEIEITHTETLTSKKKSNGFKCVLF